jgi:hypothetical protein
MDAIPTEAPDVPLVSDVIGADAASAVQFPLPQGMTGHAVHDPGEALSAEQQASVFEALVTVTTLAFEADMTPYWAHRRKERYFDLLSEFMLVSDGRGRMVGWSGYQTFDAGEFTNVYIDSTGIVSGDQSRGVMRSLFDSRIRHVALPWLARNGAPLFISARSESPIFYKLMRSLVQPGALFPHPGAAPPPDIERCARDLAERLGQTDILEPGTLVLRNAYGSIVEELYGALPSSGEPELDRLFRSELGPLDAYLLVGRAGSRPDL